MKLLLDENISYRIKPLISDIFDEIKHIIELLPYRATDIEIWEIAKLNNFTILTLDSDFRELVVLKGFPPKIIWLRTGNLSKISLARKIIDSKNIILKFEKDDSVGVLEIY